MRFGRLAQPSPHLGLLAALSTGRCDTGLGRVCSAWVNGAARDLQAELRRAASFRTDDSTRSTGVGPAVAITTRRPPRCRPWPSPLGRKVSSSQASGWHHQSSGARRRNEETHKSSDTPITVGHARRGIEVRSKSQPSRLAGTSPWNRYVRASWRSGKLQGQVLGKCCFFESDRPG